MGPTDLNYSLDPLIISTYLSSVDFKEPFTVREKKREFQRASLNGLTPNLDSFLQD